MLVVIDYGGLIRSRLLLYNLLRLYFEDAAPVGWMAETQLKDKVCAVFLCCHNPSGRVFFFFSQMTAQFFGGGAKGGKQQDVVKYHREELKL